MRAVWYEKNGAAREVLQQGTMDDPAPGAGEVRVRMAFSGVNPSDVKRRDGWSGQKIAYPRVVPNMDGSGVIDRVGSGVSLARLGQRVWLHSTMWKRPFGTCADYALTFDHRAYTLPDGISFAMGAGLGVPAMTAHRAVFGMEQVKGKTVLVTGGAGAVGFYAISLAKWGGATVLSTVSGAEKAAEAKRAGADHVINYKSENVAERVMALTGGAGIDHIVEVDLGANIATTAAVLKNGGSLATYASMSTQEPKIPHYQLMFKNVRFQWVFVYDMPREAMDAAARDTNAWLVSGHAVHPTYHRFPLTKAADAHIAVEQGATGKVIIEIGGESTGNG
ncbi:MAG: NADPH:quinone reductase [Burkholderiales bacterium]